MEIYFYWYVKDKYILAGPGRWGSADPWLGVPLNWQQIWVGTFC